MYKYDLIHYTKEFIENNIDWTNYHNDIHSFRKILYKETSIIINVGDTLDNNIKEIGKIKELIYDSGFGKSYIICDIKFEKDGMEMVWIVRLRIITPSEISNTFQQCIRVDSKYIWESGINPKEIIGHHLIKIFKELYREIIYHGVKKLKIRDTTDYDKNHEELFSNIYMGKQFTTIPIEHITSIYTGMFEHDFVSINKHLDSDLMVYL